MKGLVLKFPVVHKGSYTHLTLASSFAHFNASYLETLKAAGNMDPYHHQVQGNGIEPMEFDDDLQCREVKSTSTSAIFFNSSEQLEKPGVFADLVRAKLTELLSKSQDHTLPAEELITLLGLDPLKYPRQRKWFNRTIASLGQLGFIERIQLPKPEGYTGSFRNGATPKGFMNCIRLIRMYNITGNSILGPLEGAKSTDSGRAPSNWALESSENFSKTFPTQSNPSPLRSLEGVLIDLPFEYQIFRLIAQASNGLTANQLRKHLGNIGARPFGKFVERLLKPISSCDKYLCVRRVPEYRGRERRYRYFTYDVLGKMQCNDPNLKALLSSGGTLSNLSQVSPAPMPLEAQGICDMRMNKGETNTEESSKNTSCIPPPHVITLPQRSTIEALQRRDLLHAIIRKERVARIDYLFMRNFQEMLVAQNAVFAGSSVDKKTVMRTFRNMAVDGLVVLKWVYIPLLAGGTEKQQFVVLNDSQNPVGKEELMEAARNVECQALFLSNFATRKPRGNISPAPDVKSAGEIKPITGKSKLSSFSSDSLALKNTPNHSGIPLNPEPDLHWRLIAQEYGWVDARMLRAKYLYAFLYEKTLLTKTYEFSVTMIFREMPLGTYLQIVGHTARSESLLSYMEENSEVELLHLHAHIRNELLGTDKAKRRFKFHITQLLNVLIALNLITVPGQEKLYSRIIETTPLFKSYCVPRSVGILNYASPRSQRLVLETINIERTLDMFSLWRKIELLRSPILRNEVDETSSLSSSAPIPQGLHNSLNEAQPEAAPNDFVGSIVRPSSSNLESDPIKFISMSRNWVRSYSYSRTQRKILSNACAGINGHTLISNESACKELARKCNLPVIRVKYYLRKALESKGPRKKRQTMNSSKNSHSGSQTLGLHSGSRPYVTSPENDLTQSQGDEVRDRPNLVGNDGIGPCRRKRVRVQWATSDDLMLELVWVIFRYRFEALGAKAIQWTAASAIFPDRAADALRRRVGILLSEDEVAVRVKLRERAWSSHLSTCDCCDIDHKDLLKCVDHLSKLELATSSSHYQELPDLLEELDCNFHMLSPSETDLVDQLAHELTGRSILKVMYSTALYDAVPFSPELCSGVASSKPRSSPVSIGHSESDVEETDNLTEAKVQAVRKLLQMICLTPEPQYSSTLAFSLLHAYPAGVIEKAVALEREAGSLVRLRPNPKSRVIPGRNFVLSDRFCALLFSQTTQKQISQAVRCVSELLKHFRTTSCDDSRSSDSFFLDELADEGTMMAIIDMVSGNKLTLEIDIDLSRIYQSPLVPARAREFFINLPVYISVDRRKISKHSRGSFDSSISISSFSKPYQIRSRNSGHFQPLVRVGFSCHTFVKPTELEMAAYCVKKPVGGPASSNELFSGATKESSSLEMKGDEKEAEWILPRVWMNLDGQVVPSLFRCCLTCVLSLMLRYSGAPVVRTFLYFFTFNSHLQGISGNSNSKILTHKLGMVMPQAKSHILPSRNL
jgi:hypothetical protein